MPAAHDRLPLPVDRSPLKQLASEVGRLKYPNPIDMLGHWVGQVRDFILQAIKQVTGIDLSGWAAFIDGLPGFDAGKIISGVFNAIRIPLLDASKIVSGVFDAVMIPFLDAGKIITGVFNSARIGLLDASKIVTGTLSRAVSGIGQLIDRLFSGFGGGSQSNVSDEALTLQAATVTQTANSALAAAVAAQTAQQEIGGGSVPDGGVNVTYTLSGSDGAPLPAGWATFPNNALVIRGNAGYIGIASGAGDGQHAVIPPVVFETDDQSFAVVLGDKGNEYTSTNIHLRCNADGTRGAYAKVFDNRLAIGHFTKAGNEYTYTQLVAANLNVSGGARVEFRCHGLNYFLLVNGRQVLSVTDAANNVLQGEDYRRPMLSEGQSTNPFWTYLSFRVAAMVISDFAGAGVSTTTSWKITRSSTSDVGVSIGNGSAAVLPNNFMTTADYYTGTNVSNLGQGQVQILTSGWYKIRASVVGRIPNVTATGASTSYVPAMWALWVNNSQSTGPIAAGDDVDVYLNAGDLVQPGIVAVGDNQSSNGQQGGTNVLSGASYSLNALRGFASFMGKFESAA